MMKTRRERINGDRLTFFSSLISFALILCFPAVAGAGMRAGLTLCAHAVIPSVFPSLILTDLLFSRPTEVIEGTLGRLFARFFRVSPRGAVGWIAGLLCGFPVGAITVASDVRQGLISREEGEYLLSFVNNTGPAFLVGGVGLGLFGSAKVGWALYLLQIPVSLSVGFLFRPKAPFCRTRCADSGIAAPDPVASIVRASEGCVRIVGFVCFFSVLSSLISLFLPEGPTLALASSCLEVGTGVARAASLAVPFPALPLAAFAVCFSGASVCLQTFAALNGTGMRRSFYWRGKIASGMIGTLLCTLFCLTK